MTVTGACWTSGGHLYPTLDQGELLCISTLYFNFVFQLCISNFISFFNFIFNVFSFIEPCPWIRRLWDLLALSEHVGKLLLFLFRFS
jgi:hypothetical protein